MFRKSMLAALLAVSGSVGAGVYVVDQEGVVVRNDVGLCWRTADWTPELAAADPDGCTCDQAVLPAAACAPPVAASAAGGPVVPTTIVSSSGESFKIAADALFDFNSAVLRRADRKKLDAVIAQVKDAKGEVVVAVGHTDRFGKPEHNQRLSERRAAAVKRYLSEHGIAASSIRVEGKGAAQPLTGNACPGSKKSPAVIGCLQPDRRVDIGVTASK